MCVELYWWSIELEGIFVLPLAPRWVRQSYLSKKATNDPLYLRVIRRLYSNIGKVPSDSGIFRSTEKLREFTGRSNGPYWAIRERGRRPLALSYTLSLSLFPSPVLRKGKGFLLGLGSPSRTPYSWRTPRGPASLPLGGILLGLVVLVGLPLWGTP